MSCLVTCKVTCACLTSVDSLIVSTNKLPYFVCLETKRMEVLLRSINSTTIQLKSNFTKLNQSIADVNNQLKKNNEDTISIVADFSTLPDVQQQLENITKINKKNFSEEAEKVSFI